MLYRPIQADDQNALADGIWQVYSHFDCVGPGYGPHDPDMQDLNAFYHQPGSFYLVAVDESTGAVVGGCGFAAFGPPDEATCELRKLFLLPAARGTGAGEQLLRQTLEKAKSMNYRQCYLETVERMQAACKLYEKFGFERLEKELFGGGHHVCERKYLKALSTLALWILALILPACSSSFVPPTDEVHAAPDLRVELMSMHLVNEELRKELIEIGLSNLRLKDVYRQESLDRMHSSRLKEIVAAHGWPGIDLVGTDGSEAAFHLAEHSHREPQFQNECLELMENALQQGQVKPAHYAELFDRVQIDRGNMQRFGTQAVFHQGKIEFLPLEDPDRVDARRARMGMVPLREYRAQLEQAYFIHNDGR